MWEHYLKEVFGWENKGVVLRAKKLYEKSLNVAVMKCSHSCGGNKEMVFLLTTHSLYIKALCPGEVTRTVSTAAQNLDLEIHLMICEGYISKIVLTLKKSVTSWGQKVCWWVGNCISTQRENHSWSSLPQKHDTTMKICCVHIYRSIPANRDNRKTWIETLLRWNVHFVLLSGEGAG